MDDALHPLRHGRTLLALCATRTALGLHHAHTGPHTRALSVYRKSSSLAGCFSFISIVHSPTTSHAALVPHTCRRKCLLVPCSYGVCLLARSQSINPSAPSLALLARSPHSTSPLVLPTRFLHAQPIIQRAVNFIPLVPFALALRLVVDAAVGVRRRLPEELYSAETRLTFYTEK